MSKENMKIQFAGKVTLMKELQRTLSFKAYTTVLESGGSQTLKWLHDQSHSLYFGDENNQDSIGYAEQMLRGFGPFSPMFERGADIAKGSITLTMKRIFHCMPDDIIVSQSPNDKGINMAVLSSKRLNNRVQLSPRSVWDFGKVVERNGKKALALVMQSEYAESTKTGILPSGKSFEDYLLFIRQAMYKELRNNALDVDDEDDVSDRVDDVYPSDVTGKKDNSNDTEMKDQWFFPGYISFALWGPIMPEDMDRCYQASALLSSDGNDEKKCSPKIKKEKKSIERNGSNSIASLSMTREVSRSDYLFAASIAQQSSMATSVRAEKKIDRKMMYLKDKVKRAEREVDRWKSFLTPEIMTDPNNNLYKKFEEANEKYHEAEELLDKFVENVDNETEPPVDGLVRSALSIFKSNDDEEKQTPHMHKRYRSETPMSSIDVFMDTTSKFDELSPSNNDF